MTSITTGKCPKCGPHKNAEVIFEHDEVSPPTEEPLDPTITRRLHRVLKCAGCNTIYFQRECWQIMADEFEPDPAEPNDIDSDEFMNYFCQEKGLETGRVLKEENNYWPTFFQRPDWLPQISDSSLRDILESVYSALENDLGLLAAIGMRLVFDRVSQLAGIDPDVSFARKLDKLQKSGEISVPDQEFLGILTNAGSAAAHRGWRPEPQELRTLTSIMEHFVRRLVLKEEAKLLKGRIPPRKQLIRRIDSSAELLRFPSSSPSNENESS